MDNPVSGLIYSLVGEDHLFETLNNLILDCNVYNHKNVNLTFPIVEDYCARFDLGVSTSTQMDGTSQKGINLSFTSFKFVSDSEDTISDLGLQCSVC